MTSASENLVKEPKAPARKGPPPDSFPFEGRVNLNRNTFKQGGQSTFNLEILDAEACTALDAQAAYHGITATNEQGQYWISDVSVNAQMLAQMRQAARSGALSLIVSGVLNLAEVKNGKFNKAFVNATAEHPCKARAATLNDGGRIYETAARDVIPARETVPTMGFGRR